jgi:hypothetical protein
MPAITKNHLFWLLCMLWGWCADIRERSVGAAAQAQAEITDAVMRGSPCRPAGQQQHEQQHKDEHVHVTGLCEWCTWRGVWVLLHRHQPKTTDAVVRGPPCRHACSWQRQAQAQPCEPHTPDWCQPSAHK